MNVAEWILVVMLSCALLIFLIAGIVLAIKLIRLTEEAQKIVATGQQIATKADDIVDNVKGMTSVGGIVKTFANRVITNQERRYAEEDAARAAAEEIVTEAAEAAARENAQASRDARGKGDNAKSSKAKK
jgi:biopolymer transport protein ExbB/TolQ